MLGGEEVPLGKVACLDRVEHRLPMLEGIGEVKE